MDLELLKSTPTGPGTWRMNPLLIELESFQTLLYECLDQLRQDFEGNQTGANKQNGTQSSIPYIY
jgi:hypothetical protein